MIADTAAVCVGAIRRASQRHDDLETLALAQRRSVGRAVRVRLVVREQAIGAAGSATALEGGT